MDRMLTTTEAARRLGVKIPTLYAYVSRGLLSSQQDPVGRGSLFDLSEVEALAARSRGGRQTATRLATVTTGITQLDPCLGPLYRGRPAIHLASTESFEEVALRLWDTSLPAGAEDPDGNGDVGDGWAVPDLGPCPLHGTLERMRWGLVVCGASDPLRADLRPNAVVRAAKRCIAALADLAWPTPAVWHDTTGQTSGRGMSIATRLRTRLSPPAVARAGPALDGALDAALVLLADHELATSTVAVRVAASTRTDPYDAFLAGLATLAGPLHGGASQQVHELLGTAERDGVARALNGALREWGHLPGFGHGVYTEGDPRCAVLLDRVEPLLDAEHAVLVHEVAGLAQEHDLPAPNCDFALAALTWGTSMPADAGRAVFAVARMAGWTAHYLEELSEPPLRFRARAVYSV